MRGTVTLMESDSDKPIDIGSDRLVTIDKLAEKIIKITGKKITKTYDLSAPQGVRGRNADITLARKMLSWESKVALEDGLTQTYKWVEAKVREEA